MSAPAVEWSDPLGQAWLAICREAEPLVYAIGRLLGGPADPPSRELVLWCDHPTSRGAEGQVFEEGRHVVLWTCDTCGATFMPPVLLRQSIRPERFDQEARFGAGVLRGGEGLRTMRQAVQHHRDVVEAAAAARDAKVAGLTVVITVQTYADLLTAPPRDA